MTKKAIYQRKPPDHGTDAGYQWHRRHKVPVCDPCRMAHNGYTAAQHRSLEADRKSGQAPHKEEHVAIPLSTFAELYWTASARALRQLDEAFGRDKVDEMIKRADTLCP